MSYMLLNDISPYLEVYFKMKVAIFCFKNCPTVLSFPLFQTMAAPRSFSANLVQLFCTADKDQHHLPMVNVFRTFVPFPPLKFEKKMGDSQWLNIAPSDSCFLFIFSMLPEELTYCDYNCLYTWRTETLAQEVWQLGTKFSFRLQSCKGHTLGGTIFCRHQVWKEEEKLKSNCLHGVSSKKMTYFGCFIFIKSMSGIP